MPLFFLAILENENDKEYITSLYRQYYPLMKKRAFGFTKDYDVVDDLIQDAFLKLIPKISLLRPLNCYKINSYLVYTIIFLPNMYDNMSHGQDTERLIYCPMEVSTLPKMNKLMDRHSLQEEYEEIKIKLIMARFAELEGRMLAKENEELSKDSFYMPSEQEKKSFIKRLNLHFALFYLKRAVRQFARGYSKAAAAILLVIVMLFTAALSVEAVRVKFLNMITVVKKEYTEIWLGQDSQQLDESLIKIEWNNAYVPMKVPKGYRIINATNDKIMKSIEYKNDDHGYILFQQNNENTSMNVDTEDADEVVHTTINGQSGLVVRKKNRITVVWQDNNRLFMILKISTDLNKEELMEMAESVILLK